MYRGVLRDRKEPTKMTAVSAAVVALLTLTVAAVLHTPRDAEGNPLPRSARSWSGDVASVLGLS
jgi:hypothetical protein